MRVRVDSEWNGDWFPHKPGDADPLLDGHNSIDVTNNNNNIDGGYAKKMKTMGISDPSCDDAEVLNDKITFSHRKNSTICFLFVTQINSIDWHISVAVVAYHLLFSFHAHRIPQRNLWIDYDPKNISHHSRYICMQNRKQFEPNTTVEPILREYTIPVEYTVNNWQFNLRPNARVHFECIYQYTNMQSTFELVLFGYFDRHCIAARTNQLAMIMSYQHCKCLNMYN